MSSARFALAFLFLTAPTFAPAAERETRLFELRVYYAAPGKLDAMNSLFRDHALARFEKHGMTNIGYFMPIDNPERKLFCFLAFKDYAARKAAWSAFEADPEWQRVREESGKVVEKVHEFLLTATDYSPVVTPLASENGRVFELRPCTLRAGCLEALNDRFRTYTLKMFAKYDIGGVGYWTLATGPDIPSPQRGALKDLGFLVRDDQKPEEVVLICLHDLPSVEARRKFFGAMVADPAWKKVLADTEAKAGGAPLTVRGGVVMIMTKPTDYSPTR